MNISQHMAIEAATDGACSGNPGNGGWGGLILFDDGSEIEIGGAEINTTNNRMELMAAIKTLEKLKEFKIKDNFKLRTDSKYVIEGYSNWIKNWKKNGWKTSAGKPVQNIDLWQKIDELRITGLKMEFVKGHNGDKYNERVDLIATNYSKGISLKKETKQKSYLNDQLIDKVSPEIVNLYTRIELVSKFAQKGYLLDSYELCQLLSIKENKFIQKFEQFEWRNWLIKPTITQKWQIQEIKTNS
tara:strand:- start:6341 stop:7069 length:729 start_codon:yes stop_codon:yes gene_type:complete